MYKDEQVEMQVLAIGVLVDFMKDLDREWRVIADMKNGGQNAHIGKDPVFLYQPEAILSQLFAEGYTAVADASKFFYQFPTFPKERKYLALASRYVD
jgi:hypothetical protein